jgi:hypothetical protein
MNWKNWEMKSSDEYEKGYGGKELKYDDEGFYDRECKENKIWL